MSKQRVTTVVIDVLHLSLLWGHVAHACLYSSDGPSDISDSLLLAHTVVMILLASAVCCYCGGTWRGVVATSLHSTDVSSDINNPLLLTLTIAMGLLTSEVYCYCGDTWYGRGYY
jgi:hypothetical protein